MIMETFIDWLIEDDYNPNKIHVNDLNELKMLRVFLLLIDYFVNVIFQVERRLIRRYFHRLFQYLYEKKNISAE
jgi:uncharacterized membrane protein YcfT